MSDTLRIVFGLFGLVGGSCGLIGAALTLVNRRRPK